MAEPTTSPSCSALSPTARKDDVEPVRKTAIFTTKGLPEASREPVFCPANRNSICLAFGRTAIIWFGNTSGNLFPFETPRRLCLSDNGSVCRRIMCPGCSAEGCSRRRNPDVTSLARQLRLVGNRSTFGRQFMWPNAGYCYAGQQRGPSGVSYEAFP